MADKKKQIHVEVPEELKQRILNICTESGQISILTRRLYRSFLKHMDINKAGEDVAKGWEDGI
jgi:hypothetical protein